MCPQVKSPALIAEPPCATFPETKYMGSKRRLLPFIQEQLSGVRFETVLDAFSGTGCVSYLLKQMGKQVTANDFLSFCFHTANATIENDEVTLDDEDFSRLLRPNPRASTFVRDTFRDLYFDDDDSGFLDNLWSNLREETNRYKRSLTIAAACRASMKKRPRGLFTTTGKKGWDSRLDLRLSMKDQFLAAAAGFNGAVFDNGCQNRATNIDVFAIDGNFDLVYLDPPYISKYSDCDYTRRYHFVEGLATYWQNHEIMHETKTKKIRSYETAFASKTTAAEAFRRVFEKFSRSMLVVSYSSNCVPSKSEMVSLLQAVKDDVRVFEFPHRYHHGNHGHKVGENNNAVSEYLFIAS